MSPQLLDVLHQHGLEFSIWSFVDNTLTGIAQSPYDDSG